MTIKLPVRNSRWAGLWFPSALVVLSFLALPGVVLLLLALLGKENAINAWLQNHLHLSYHLSISLAPGLLLLLIPPLLILLYFLKLKRQPLQVPSTFLWRKSIQDLRVNSLFQWLRDNVLLLLQLLVVLLLIYSVLGLQVQGSTSGGKHYILLLDNSASMLVRDVEGSRLDLARREALREIDAHGDNDSGMVIAFNSRAAILQPYTSNRALLRSAVEQITQTRRVTRLEEALQLADSLANPLRSTDDAAVRPTREDPAQKRTYVPSEGIAAEVHLFSDGRFPDIPTFAAGNLDLHYHRIGRPGAGTVDNVGIVALTAQRDEQDPGKLRVFTRILNFRPAATKVTLEVRLDGRLRDIRPLTLPARLVAPADAANSDSGSDTPGERDDSFVLADVGDDTEAVVHARLVDADDAFPLDNEAWLVCGGLRKARVLVVSTGNEILHDFFDQEATRRVAMVHYLTPADLADEAKYGRPARTGAFDLVVFDRCAPPRLEELPRGNTFFLGDVPPPWKRETLPLLKDTRIRNPTSNHPLMRHLTALDEIAFSEAFHLDLQDPRVPPRTPRLLETAGDTAVLFVLSRHAYQDLVMAFPLLNARGEWATTWPLMLSFPVFLRNVLYTLGHVSDAAAEENVHPGEIKTLHPATTAPALDVVAPDGTRSLVPRSQGEFSYKHTEQVGVYQASWPDGQAGFAVNLLDADESDIEPRDEIQIGSQRLVAGTARRQTYETWKWLVVAALAFLLLEWAVYHRRIFF